MKEKVDYKKKSQCMQGKSSINKYSQFRQIKAELVKSVKRSLKKVKWNSFD